MVGGEPYSLWTDRISRRLEFDRVSIRLFDTEMYAPYLFISTIILLDVPILSTLSFLAHNGQTVHPLLDYSWWFLVPLGLFVGVFGAHCIRSKVATAIESAGRTTGKISVSDLAPLRAGLLALALVLYYWIIIPNLPQLFLAEGTIVGAIKWLVIIPFVYVVVIVELFAVYVHGLLFLPHAIERQEVPLDFLDSKKLGGMKPVGSVIITATEFYFLGLAFWTGTTLIGPLTGTAGAIKSGPGIKSIAFFVLAWFLGVSFFAVSLQKMHSYMHNQKYDTIDRIADEVRDFNRNREPFPYGRLSNREELLEYNRYHIDFLRIEQTKTYPVDVGKLWELFGTALFPMLLQVLSVVL